ncbi:MAG: hypothetical protein VB140_00035 [Burkholderia sp.]|uniref:LgaM n=1 Tax=Burkholderia gladioli TaxID=28095 RepID=A0A2Z4XG56_BURGA|nr:LgaM [Burkholderia gladioli]KAF1018236.1 MAG: hypothetical protein E5299_00017 [Burkholderia gladioli]
MAYRSTIYLDWGTFFLIETPAASIQPLLPASVRPLLAASGAAILTLNVVHFLAGGEQVDLPANHEIDIGVLVELDNSEFEADLPQASVAIHVLKVASTARGYVDLCQNTGYRVIDPVALAFEINPATLTASVCDADGPILGCRQLDLDLEYDEFRRIGQDVMYDAERGIHRANYIFSGKGLSRPMTNAMELRVHAHPFFADLGIEPGVLVCLDQFALKPSSRSSLAFYRPNQVEMDETVQAEKD